MSTHDFWGIYWRMIVRKKTLSNRPLLRRLPAALLPLLLVTGVGTSFAADHKDGTRVKENPDWDISDFFIFPRVDERQQKRLSLILSAHPGATSTTLFSDVLIYSFRMRAVKGFQKDPFKATVSDEEFRIDCRVSGTAQQVLSCELARLQAKGAAPESIMKATVSTRDTGGGSNPDFKIFGGPRADQLFTDRARVRMPVWRDTDLSSAKEWPGVNTFDGKNVLSIVVDLNTEKLLKADTHLLAATAESSKMDAGKMQRLDRMGRVEITVFMIREKNSDIQDLWNADDAFSLDPENVKRYRPVLDFGLHRMDGFEMPELDATDKKVFDWPEPHPWVDLLMDDFLIVNLDNPTKPSSDTKGYLGIEMAEFRGAPASAVGGRLPNEDVIETTLTVFINGLDRLEKPKRGVGVSKPARMTEDTFPFVPPAFEPPPETARTLPSAAPPAPSSEAARESKNGNTCGCGVSGSPATGWLGVGLGLLLAMRRRRART
jgi:MYXO-CTERM domain-containing protein